MDSAENGGPLEGATADSRTSLVGRDAGNSAVARVESTKSLTGKDEQGAGNSESIRVASQVFEDLIFEAVEGTNQVEMQQVDWAKDEGSEGADSFKANSKVLFSESKDLDFDFSFFMRGEEGVEEESGAAEEENESTPVSVDRDPYYEVFSMAMKDFGTAKRLNNFLHHKLSIYFMQREMIHVLKEVDHPGESLLKYAMKLDQFDNLIKHDRETRAKLGKELGELRAKRDHLKRLAAESFADLQRRERETGTGLIYTKTGKELTEKVLSKCLSNQYDKTKELQQLRLQHVKVKNATADTEAIIKKINKISNKCTLVEFEQLKMENRSFMDKIEERDEELFALRKTCNCSIQSLAHLKERSAETQYTLTALLNEKRSCDTLRCAAREEVIKVKHRRDYYRKEVLRLSQSSGLITKDKLLLDMQRTMEENELLEQELLQTTERYDKLTAKVTNLKGHLERESRRLRFERPQLSVLKKRS